MQFLRPPIFVALYKLRYFNERLLTWVFNSVENDGGSIRSRWYELILITTRRYHLYIAKSNIVDM